MNQACRLPAGGRIDRRTRLAFTFNGRRYEGHAGDTLASGKDNPKRPVEIVPYPPEPDR